MIPTPHADLVVSHTAGLAPSVSGLSEKRRWPARGTSQSSHVPGAAATGEANAGNLKRRSSPRGQGLHLTWFPPEAPEPRTVPDP